MPLIKHSALVAHSAKEMYEMVIDVPSYPGFLPWCKAARVMQDDGDSQLAAIAISSTLKQTEFTTCNTLDPCRKVSMQLVEGPFKQLQGSWYFHALADAACKVELELEFEFASSTLARAIKPVFTEVASTLIDAFVAEAGRRYPASMR